MTRRSVEEWTRLGKLCAEKLATGAFQIEAAMYAGLSHRTYYEALDGDGDGHMAFQAEVLPMLAEQARKAEEKAEIDIASCENGSGAWANWHKWKLEKRHRKFFGDLAQKVEVTGKGGGPVQTLDLSTLPTEALLGILKEVEPDDDE